MKPEGVEGPRFLLVKRDLYYRPDRKGYTGTKENAGRYFASDAMPESGVTAIHEDDAPEFTKACFDDLAREHLQKKLATLQAENKRLREALTPSAYTKAAYIGEFSFLFPVFNGDGEEVVMTPTVPWTTTKEIMAAILKRAESGQ